LTKLRPFDTWGEWDFDVRVEQGKSEFGLNLLPTGSPVKGAQVFPENPNDHYNNSGAKANANFGSN
jgi:hypothetical protein